MPQGLFRSTKLEDLGFGLLLTEHIGKTADDPVGACCAAEQRD